MKLKKQLPIDRSYDQIMNHYLIEKSIAEKIKKSNSEERKLIYATMYDELFSKVPDHPRLTRRNSMTLSAKLNKEKLSLIRKFIDKSSVFLEFAPGDCRFSFEVAKHVKKAYGVDISDQHNPNDHIPENFQLIIYDGYDLNEIQDNSIDIMFSDQLIEHFHPEETKLHFEIAHRILKNRGKYIFRTPHNFTGPHDISAYFCDEPEGFHLKEWTYTEIKQLLKDLKYSEFQTRWRKKGIELEMPYYYYEILEKILSKFPKKHCKKISRLLIPSLYGIAIK